MTSSRLKQYYLNAIGIVNWQLRDKSNACQTLTQTSLPSPCYMGLFEKNNAKWLLFAEATSEASDQTKETQLLSAICRAIGFPDLEIKWFQQPSLELLLLDQIKNIDHVILFGSKMIEIFDQDFGHNAVFNQPNAITKKYEISRMTLGQLLQEPKLKAKLWREVQPLCALMKSAVISSEN
jgi:hypothetical protein